MRAGSAIAGSEAGPRKGTEEDSAHLALSDHAVQVLQLASGHIPDQAVWHCRLLEGPSRRLHPPLPLLLLLLQQSRQLWLLLHTACLRPHLQRDRKISGTKALAPTRLQFLLQFAPRASTCCLPNEKPGRGSALPFAAGPVAGDGCCSSLPASAVLSFTRCFAHHVRRPYDLTSHEDLLYTAAYLLSRTSCQDERPSLDHSCRHHEPCTQATQHSWVRSQLLVRKPDVI